MKIPCNRNVHVRRRHRNKTHKKAETKEQPGLKRYIVE